MLLMLLILKRSLQCHREWVKTAISISTVIINPWLQHKLSRWISHIKLLQSLQVQGRLGSKVSSQSIIVWKVSQWQSLNRMKDFSSKQLVSLLYLTMGSVLWQSISSISMDQLMMYLSWMSTMILCSLIYMLYIMTRLMVSGFLKREMFLLSQQQPQLR